ncbi:hypothetical protein Deipr_0500 [Deinococcus proteolyticus MRP]|uniref:Uncharacterized protein n=1 Tax=Deinococcus proteolyticus (strain ATCC 35074 / DSM 20540 / JCM 6276 / NBRC 101906 / NCIMB 13154 / VKM Ac-1939 / CCM 2703 / MRP) TaxID=693977 RepID=F0RKA8_DEIPM|nr:MULTISPECIES: hypothetical protein [Deinococcus]ADY25667.1 hypothetical protein Deipr_0500 [Deinococcus proteolyticus MRP]MCY1701784.1 hypothetical protein [Deinococcus sp. SL84]
MFKKITFAVLLAVFTSALADSSVSTDYDNASLSLTAAGTYAQAVSFSVPRTAITLSAAQIRPGNSFTVSIPVTNTTDREIDVAAVAAAPTGTGAAHLKVTAQSASATLPAGGQTNLTFLLSFDDSTDVSQGEQTVSVVFDVSATAAASNTSGADSSF